MALNVTVPQCYCCAHEASSRMDIDAALDELGMLSTVTESRKQYMQERLRTRSESSIQAKRQLHMQPSTRSLPSSSSSSSYQIVHIDTKYVTGFSDTPTETTEATPPGNMTTHPSYMNNKPSDGAEVFVDYSKNYRTQPENLDSSIDRRRRMRLSYRREDITARSRRLLARKRTQQPYEVPWRLTQSFQESDLLSQCSDTPESKSNTSSPVKSFSTDCLPRSRSLDNLDFSSFFITDTGEKQDIDKVASGFKNLNMADT